MKKKKNEASGGYIIEKRGARVNQVFFKKRFYLSGDSNKALFDTFLDSVGYQGRNNTIINGN